MVGGASSTRLGASFVNGQKALLAIIEPREPKCGMIALIKNS